MMHRLRRGSPKPPQVQVQSSEFLTPDWVRKSLGDAPVDEAIDAIEMFQNGNKVAAFRKIEQLLEPLCEGQKQHLVSALIPAICDTRRRISASSLFANALKNSVPNLVDSDAADLVTQAFGAMNRDISAAVSAACNLVLRAYPADPAAALSSAYYRIVCDVCRCSEAEELALADAGFKRAARRPSGDAASSELVPAEKILCRLWVGSKPLPPEQAERLAEAHFSFWEQHRKLTRALLVVAACRQKQAIRTKELTQWLKSIKKDELYIKNWLLTDREMQRLGTASAEALLLIQGSPVRQSVSRLP